MSKQIKDSEETKRKIIHAAKKEFANKGFSGARMSSIASIAGVNQALLHYHFESKEKLYRNIFHFTFGDDINEYAEKIGKEIASWKETPDIELCAAIYLLISTHLEAHDDDINRILAREIAEGHGVIHEFVKNYMLPRIAMLEGIIKCGIKEGIFEISNPMLFVINLLSFISDYVHGEEFIKGTIWYDQLYKDKKNTIYNYIIETSFKALRPAGRELKYPSLSRDKKLILDNIVKEYVDRISSI
jgi:TetR/AcrR family transcriptional regulator